MTIDLGSLSAKIDLATSEFSKGIDEINKGFANVDKKAVSLNKSLDEVAKGFDGVKVNAGSLNKALQDSAKLTDVMGKHVDSLNNVFEIINNSFKEINRNAAIFSKSIQKVGKSFSDTAQIEKYEKAIQDLQKDIEKLKTQFEKLENSKKKSEGFFTSLGKSALYLNQSLELVQKGYRLFETAIGSTIAPIFQTGVEVARLKKSYDEIFDSTEQASAEFVFLRETSERLGQNFYDLAESYKLIAAASRGTVLEGEGTRKIFEAVTKASASLGLSADNTKGSLYALSQMISKGSVTSEELRQQLGERLPGAFNLMAEAAGVSTGKLQKMLANGEVGIDTLLKFADVLENKYTGAIDPGTRAMNKFNEALTDLKAEIGQGEFMDVIVDSIKNITQLLKDPSFKQSLKEIVDGLANVVLNFSKIAKYAGLRSIGGTFEQAILLSKKGLIDISEFAKLGFMERQRLVDDILEKQRQLSVNNFDDTVLNILDGSFFGQGSSDYVSVPESKKKNPISNIPEMSEGAEKALEDLQKRIGDINFEKQVIGAEKWDAEVKKVSHEAVNLRLKYDEFFKQAPKLEGMIGQWERLAIEMVNAQRAQEAKNAIKQLKEDVDNLSFEKSIIGMNQWDISIARTGQEVKNLRDDLSSLFKSKSEKAEFEKWLKAFEKFKVAISESQKTESISKAIEELNKQIKDTQSSIGQLNGLSDWDSAISKIKSNTDDLIRKYKEEYGTIPSAIQQTIDKLEELRIQQEAAKQSIAVNGLFGQQPAMFENLFNVDGLSEYKDGLKAIADEYNRMVQAGGELSSFADVWYDQQKAMLDYANTVSQIKGAFMSMTGAMSDALVEFAKTGKISLRDLAKAMYDELVIYAASYTAKLLMTAAFEAAMGIYSIASNDGRSGLHFAAAKEALVGAGMMGSFVLGSGLAGMAHDGISNIPEDGTWLLKKNERVIDPDTNADLKAFLKDGGKSVTISMPVTIQGGDEQGVLKALPLMREVAISAVTESLSSRGDVFKTIQVMRP